MRVLSFVAAVLVLAGGAGLAQLPEELARRLKDPDADVRRLAAEELARQKAETAVPALAGLLRDPAAKVRDAAADALVRIGPKSVPALAGALAYPEEAARLKAATALLRIIPKSKERPSKELVPALAAALKDQNVDVRIHAAYLLGRLGAEARSALPALRAAARDTGNLGSVLRPTLPSGVARAAVRAALQVDPSCVDDLAREALPDLTAALKSKDMAIVQAAAAALVELGPRARPAEAALRQAEKSARGFARDAITGALEAMDGGRAPGQLADVITDPKAPLQRRLDALSKLRWTENVDERIVTMLAGALKDPEPRVRAAAVDAVSTLGPKAKAALPALVGLLGDNQVDRASDLKQADDLVPHALARIGKESASAVAAVLKDEKKDPYTRYQAARALSLMGRKARAELPALAAGVDDRLAVVAVESACAYARAGGDPARAVALLRVALRHQVPLVRSLAARAVEQIGPPAAATVPDLTALLKSSDREVRLAAARALAAMGPAAKPAVPAMGELLRSADGRQRYQAAMALERLGPDAAAALPALVERLKDLEPSKPHPVLTTLANLGPAAAPAVPAVLELLENDRGHFHREALDVLGRIGPGAKAAVPRLVELLDDKSEWTRAAAARALGGIGPDARVALPTLKKRLTDEKKGVRVWAAFALIRVTGNGKAHLPLLLELWKADDEGDRPLGGMVRFDVAQAFALLGPEARPVRDLLLEALLDEKTPAGTHAHVTRALVRMADDADVIVPKLIALVQRKADGYPRQAHCEHAIEALGRLGPKAKAATAALEKLLDHDEDSIAAAAARALEKVRAK